MTAGVRLNPGATFTIPNSFTILPIRSRSPSSCSSVAKIDSPVSRAAR